jgi:hypothetical protein
LPRRRRPSADRHLACSWFQPSFTPKGKAMLERIAAMLVKLAKAQEE